MPFNVLSVTIRVSPIYTCKECDRRSVGDAHRLEFLTLETAEDFVAAGSPSSAHMPESWGSFHDGFRCPDCIAR